MFNNFIIIKSLYNMKYPRHKVFIPLMTLFMTFFRMLFGDIKKESAQTEKLISIIKSYWVRKNCILMSTWRIGLYYTLKHLNLDKDDEIIITPLCIADTVNCIKLNNLSPILVDLDINTHCISITDLKKKISKKTKVIHITYLSGMVPDLEEILKICKEKNIKLIEDISQNYGARDTNNKLLGSQGHISVGSFSFGKCFASIGGGFLITDDNQLFKKIKKDYYLNIKKVNRFFLIRHCFFQLLAAIATSKYIFNFFTYYIFVLLIKTNKKIYDNFHKPKFRINSMSDYMLNSPVIREEWPNTIFWIFSDIHATPAIKTYRLLDKGIEKRRYLARILIENISEKVKSNIPTGSLDYNKSVYFHLVIYNNINNNKNDIYKFHRYLLANKIDAVGYGLYLINNDSSLGLSEFKTPNAKYIKDNSIFIPMHESYEKNDMIYMAKILNKYFDDQK
ncbi:aminotransferase [Candidatus Pelagibacter ubique HTCC1002]|uniref:Aminotransferase n=4 Tax=Pelagibacter ubique TaxID=198252 RepID=Q4FN84_PELUB|nr:aminotransferase [Candidatus Pelagibacter ubique HTCC1062]EAS84783.1 aminotransferase [Candidatus Pelagibacter ubique HTCC1002]